MRLQETAAAVAIPPPMKVALEANFTSVDRWKTEFIALARTVSPASGWMLLNFLPRDGSLANKWVAARSRSLLGAVPVLALELHEQADIAALVGNIRWDDVHQRYQRAVHCAAESLVATEFDLEGADFIDVRRAGVFDEATDIVHGAIWRDPARLPEWAGDVRTGQQVVVYCVAGHEMSRSVALRLRAAGMRVSFLEGGIEAWKASGKPTAPKLPSSDPPPPG